MFKHISILLILSLLTSCMQANLKDELEFDGQDSAASDIPNDDYSNESTPYETEFLGARSMNVRFGDYKFMSNFLKQKFGPSCNNTIMSNVWNKPQVFGAVCDYYDRNESCNTATINNPMVLTSTMRSGRIMKACEEIVSNNTCISYFLGQAGLSSSSALNEKNILKAYQFFYPLAETLSEDQQIAFSNLSDQFRGATDKWRAVSLALCVSPEWQIP
jgi:hypothetical protein